MKDIKIKDYVNLIVDRIEAIVDSIDYYLEKKDIDKARDSVQNLLKEFATFVTLLLKIMNNANKIEIKEEVC